MKNPHNSPPLDFSYSNLWPTYLLAIIIYNNMSTALCSTRLDSTEIILYIMSVTAVVVSILIAGYLNQNLYSNHWVINTCSCIILVFHRILFFTENGFLLLYN